MEEKLYKKMKSVGVSNLVFGIVTIAFGIGAGVMMIVNGARLLAHKSDILLYICVCLYTLYSLLSQWEGHRRQDIYTIWNLLKK